LSPRRKTWDNGGSQRQRPVRGGTIVAISLKESFRSTSPQTSFHPGEFRDIGGPTPLPCCLAILGTLSTYFDRSALESLRDHKRQRNFYRLASPQTIQHEFRGQFGHPSSYALVKFDCLPADDLSFEACAVWPATVSESERRGLEQAIAEAIADVLLADVYQHSGCALRLVEVRYDEVGSSQASFMKAAKRAMQELMAGEWTMIIRRP